MIELIFYVVDELSLEVEVLGKRIKKSQISHDVCAFYNKKKSNFDAFFGEFEKKLPPDNAFFKKLKNVDEYLHRSHDDIGKVVDTGLVKLKSYKSSDGTLQWKEIKKS